LIIAKIIILAKTVYCFLLIRTVNKFQRLCLLLLLLIINMILYTVPIVVETAENIGDATLAVAYFKGDQKAFDIINNHLKDASYEID